MIQIQLICASWLYILRKTNFIWKFLLSYYCSMTVTKVTSTIDTFVCQMLFKHNNSDDYIPVYLGKNIFITDNLASQVY